jgi:hypothetical protein
MSSSENGAIQAQTIGDHAVVGASMAGLLATRVLSDAYQRVTIIQRDEPPPVGEGRKAVPQGRHARAPCPSWEPNSNYFPLKYAPP